MPHLMLFIKIEHTRSHILPTNEFTLVFFFFPKRSFAFLTLRHVALDGKTLYLCHGKSKPSAHGNQTKA